MNDTDLTLFEVGPRDGLQDEAAVVATDTKLELIDALAAAGLQRIEIGSFVSPKAVPRMADSADVAEAVRARHGDNLEAYGLVINDKGYDRAVATGLTAVSIVWVASDSLCERNNRMTPAQSLDVATHLVRRATADGLLSRVYLAAAWVCPFDGPTDPGRVIDAAAHLAAAGATELSVADTIGHADPAAVRNLFRHLTPAVGATRLAAHLHDTQALGLANVAAALDAGVRTFDASIGGLGGCPFAPGAAGNVATEDVVLLADKLGLKTGIELDALWSAVAVAENAVGHTLGGRSKCWWQSGRPA